MVPRERTLAASSSGHFGECCQHEVKALMDKGGEVGAIFLDLQKVFDTENHNNLLHKLFSFNFDKVCKFN